MTTRTSEERHRLSVIRILFERIQATSTERIPISEIAHDTGISPSSLSKWLKEDVAPRKSSFQVAEQALLAYLNSRLATDMARGANDPVQGRTELLSQHGSHSLAAESFFERPNMVPIAVGIGIGLVIGLCGGAIVTALML